MNRPFKLLCLSAGTSAIFAASSQAVIVVDDDFTDGVDTSWYTSSSSSGIELNADSLGLVTGSSGRGIHTVFATQTLANDGDSLTVSYSFDTPATVGSGSSSAFRVGLFDTLDRAGDLSMNISASSSSPNAVYGLAGTADGLPGYMLDHDVNTDATADLNFRDHNTDSATGRLLATTSSGSFSSFSSGPDAGYTFDPNTSYTGSITATRLSATELELTATFDGNTYTVVDDDPDSFSFGFLGFHANSRQFGSSNSAGDPDNGLDFTSFSVEFNPVPEPSTAVLGLAGLGLLAKRRRA